MKVPHIYLGYRGAIADKMREYREEHRSSVATRTAVTLANYLTTWLNALSIRPSTFKLREHMIRKHIVPHIGARKLSELTSDDVRFLLRRWKDDDVGLVTRRTAFVTLSCALNVAFVKTRSREIRVRPSRARNRHGPRCPFWTGNKR